MKRSPTCWIMFTPSNGLPIILWSQEEVDSFSDGRKIIALYEDEP